MRWTLETTIFGACFCTGHLCQTHRHSSIEAYPCGHPRRTLTGCKKILSVSPPLFSMLLHVEMSRFPFAVCRYSSPFSSHMPRLLHLRHWYCWSCPLCLGFPLAEGEKKVGDRTFKERRTTASTSQGDIGCSTRAMLEDPHCLQYSVKGFCSIFLCAPALEVCLGVLPCMLFSS